MTSNDHDRVRDEIARLASSKLDGASVDTEYTITSDVETRRIDVAILSGTGDYAVEVKNRLGDAQTAHTQIQAYADAGFTPVLVLRSEWFESRYSKDLADAVLNNCQRAGCEGVVTFDTPTKPTFNIRVGESTPTIRSLFGGVDG